MNQESFIQDRLLITVKDSNGNTIDRRETYRSTPWQRFMKLLGFGRCYADDLITNVCLADIATFLTTQYLYVSVGTGITPTVNTDTALEAEIGRFASDNSVTTTFYTGDTAMFYSTIIPPYDASVTESGIHKAATSSGDRMGARETFSAISLTNGVNMIFDWKLIVMR